MKVTLKSGLVNDMLIPCGKCAGCLKDYQDEWLFRLKQEQRSSDVTRFYTLTYDEAHCPYNDEFQLEHLQKFMKRLRKSLDKKGVKVRYFIVGEYGSERGRPHYHALFFYTDDQEKVLYLNDVLELDCLVRDLWFYGQIEASSADIERLVYVTKYIINRDPEKKEVYRNNHFMTCSRRPGLGSAFVEKYGKYYHDNNITYVSDHGIKQKMPRAYRKKIFSDLTDEEKMLMMDNQKLQHQEKYLTEKLALQHKYNCSDGEAAQRHREQRRALNQRIFKKNQEKFNQRKEL